VKRGLLVLLGVVLLLLGTALIGAGAAVAALVGSDDSLSTAPARLHGDGVALVAEDLTIDASNIPVPPSVGTLTLSVTAPDGRAMFVGTAAPKDVDTYLAGAPYDVVVDMSSGRTGTTRRVPGTQQPPPPAGQGFWTSQATGTPASLSTAISPSDTVVVMNADAAQRVDADVVVTFTVKNAFRGAIAGAGVGVLLLVLAVLAFWRARVAGRRAREAKAAAQDALTAPAVAAATVLPGVDAPPTEADASIAAPVDGAADPAGAAPAAPAEPPPSTEPPVDVEPPLEVAEVVAADVDAAAPAAGDSVTVAPVGVTAASGALTPTDPVAVAAVAFAADAVADERPTEATGSTDAAAGVGAAVVPTAPEAAGAQAIAVAVPDESSATPIAAESRADGVDVPAWAVAGGPDTLTGDELAAPPQGDVEAAGGFADEAARAAAVAGDTGALAAVVVPDGTSTEPDPVDESPAPPAAAEPPAVTLEAGPEQTPVPPPAVPFERLDAPLYDELNTWFREEPSGEASSEH
jgi:hypothetical protein